ncbi:hypothetical protein Y032_0149g2699 [Ancylostoma ceylanicum]|uniref:Uncharacterized protein n=1 Tax=Ancylostoma ceylanicum TaxID=53326 RepID=A0A016T1I2_9BILA|nr:hypothetical protein Y032_0149g2699 [Ancylostoma ceylanicum]
MALVKWSFASQSSRFLADFNHHLAVASATSSKNPYSVLTVHPLTRGAISYCTGNVKHDCHSRGHNIRAARASAVDVGDNVCSFTSLPGAHA